MSKAVRALALFGAAAISLSAISGCAQQSGGNAASGGTSAAASSGAVSNEEPVDLVFMVPGDMAAEPLKDDDRIVAEINKRLGINLIVKGYPQGDYEKVYVAMGAGDIPDVLTTQYPNSNVNSWISDGILVPLNDYFQDIPTIADKLQNEFQWTAVDGKYYGYTFIETKSSNSTLIYRPDWLEKVKLEPPTNTDELYQVLKAFTTQDPDGDGKADTYGISAQKFDQSDLPGSGQIPGGLGFLFYAFGVDHADWAADADGNVIPLFESPEYQQALQYIRTLYAEQILDPEFLQNDTQALEQKLYQGRIGFSNNPGFRNWGRIKTSFLEVNPDGKLDYLKDFIAGPDGDKGSSAQSKSGMITSVTNKAKDPLKAAEFIELLLSPSGRDLLQNGIEGIHYTKNADGTIVYNEEERAKDNFAPNGWAHPLAWGHVIWPLTILYIPDSDPNKAENVETAEIATKYIVKNLLPYSIDKELEPTQLSSINQEYFAKIVTGTLDFDAGLAEWSSKWRAQGGEELLKSLTEEYNKLQK